MSDSLDAIRKDLTTLWSDFEKREKELKKKYEEMANEIKKLKNEREYLKETNKEKIESLEKFSAQTLERSNERIKEITALLKERGITWQ